MAKRRFRPKRFLIIGLASLLILAGLVVGLVRLADLATPGYRQDVAEWASAQLDRPISIGAMDLVWGWRGPVLKLGDVVMLQPDTREPVLNLREFALHFSLLDLLSGDRQPAGIKLAGTQITVYRDPTGQFKLQGFEGGEGSFDLTETANSLQSLNFINVTDTTVFWRQFEHQPVSDMLRLGDIEAQLTNRGPRHRLNAQGRLPPQLGGQLQVQSFVYGDLARPQEVRAHNYIKADNLNVVGLLQMAGLQALSAQAERSDLEVWGDWEKGGFTGARLSLGNAQAATTGGLLISPADREPADTGRLLPAGMAVDLSVLPNPTGYRLSIDSISSPDGYFGNVGGAALLDPQGPSLTAELTELPAGFAAAVLRLLQPGQFGDLQAQGLIPRLNFGYDAARQDNPMRLSLNFAELRIQDPQRGLDLGVLTGSMAATARNGRLRIDQGAGAWSWPPYLRGELPVAQLRGMVDWRRSENGWHFQAEDWHWHGADAQLSGGGSVQLGDAAPEVDLQLRASSEDMPAVLEHLTRDEAALPAHELRRWLASAVQAGRMPQATLRLKGVLDDRFPYKSGDGDFIVDARFENTRLNYEPAWPGLTDAAGSVSIRGDRLQFEAKSGAILDIPIARASGGFADLRKPVLQVKGQVRETGANRLFSFLSKSPLKADFGEITRVLTVGGRAALEIDLVVPLKSELGEPEVNGSAALLGASVGHAVLPKPIDNIHGTLRFDRDGLYADALRGNMGQIPVIADIAPGADESISVNASALPVFPAHKADLATLVPSLVLDALEGESVWHVGLNVADGGRVSDVSLRSDLAGLAIDMPQPMGKAAATTAPTLITIVADGSRIHVDMAGRADVDIKLRDEQLAGMRVVFGPGGTPAPIGDGLRVTGRLSLLDASAWQDFLDRIEQAAQGGDGASLPLLGINLEVASTSLWGQRLGPLRLEISSYQQRGYEAQFTGQGGNGSLQWLPAPAQAGARALLTGRVRQLSLSNPRQDRTTTAPPTAGQALDNGFDPARFPITDLRIDSLRINGRDFGGMNLQARAIDAGIEVPTLEISGGVMNLAAQGHWQRKQGLTSAALSGEINGQGLDTLLRTLNYTATIRADKTRITTNLTVSPNEAGLAPSYLHGQVSMQIEQGALLNVEPGAGRVLGLLNFYALPRRLNLDFRDVLSEGLAFDEIDGDFRIANGLAVTDSLTIKTPSASIEIDGAINLAERTYDERVRIKPQLSAGVALAGTVLGGPAVGAALLVAQRLLEKPIQKISQISYRLKGSWDDPRIETVEGEQ